MLRNIGLIFGMALMAAPSFASGVLSIGQVNGSAGGTVVVPIFAQISPDSALGRGKGRALQAFAFRVRFQPAEAVVSIEVQRAGATKAGEPLFESSPRTPGSISYIASFEEEKTPLAIIPGERVLIAELRVTLSDKAGKMNRVELHIEPRASSLSNQAGTIEETAERGTLQLVDGSITITSRARGSRH